LHIPFEFIAYYLVGDFFLFFGIFLQGRGSVCPEGYAGLSQGWLWECCIMLICSPVGLPDVSQPGLVPASGSMGALLFSQCNVAWRSSIWAGGSGHQSFDSSWCFFSAKCGSNVSARFLITELMLSASAL
jgi:hypothetical protein